MGNDLFEDMKIRIDCTYISDLPFQKHRVWNELKYMSLADYPDKQKEDFFRYVFDIDYSIFLKHSSCL